MTAKPYHKGFWNWCKENHPEVVKQFYEEMQEGIRELEHFVEEWERKNEQKKQ